MGQRLFVGNLPYETSELELESLFAGAGSVNEVRLVRDMATGRARGFAFVEMSSETEAQSAIQQFHEHDLGGRKLQVNEARPQVPRGGGGGGAGGPRQRREPRW